LRRGGRADGFAIGEAAHDGIVAGGEATESAARFLERALRASGDAVEGAVVRVQGTDGRDVDGLADGAGEAREGGEGDLLADGPLGADVDRGGVLGRAAATGPPKAAAAGPSTGPAAHAATRATALAAASRAATARSAGASAAPAVGRALAARLTLAALLMDALLLQAALLPKACFRALGGLCRVDQAEGVGAPCAARATFLVLAEEEDGGGIGVGVAAAVVAAWLFLL
jgi:hypothetical protein